MAAACCSHPADFSHAKKMEALFGSSKTPAEKMKGYQRSIKKSIREMDRERTGLERQEKKLMADIKKEAKAGRNDSAKIMAKDLVRTRKFQQKMWKMKSHMEAVSLRLQTMSSSQQMAQCMKGVTKAMGMMNKKVRTLHAWGTRPPLAAHLPTRRPGAPGWCADEPAADLENYAGV